MPIYFLLIYTCNFCCKVVLNDEKMVRWLAFCCPGFVGQYRFRPMVNFTDEQLSTLLTSANQNSSNCHICNG
ncbi:hypothetical protein T4D_1890 [Trichinella pseudospiralis]|uniref:Uncharacterized protein n=1 Tax=Trichinella pseudospiralis TaxID=6337 RepID=A0A0V1FWD1_TRIPS|nr:hypothetical protein T4D_1890 [Trichinella pseudospiralis]